MVGQFLSLSILIASGIAQGVLQALLRMLLFAYIRGIYDPVGKSGHRAELFSSFAMQMQGIIAFN